MSDDLTQARLRELLSYDPETGIFRWLKAAPRRQRQVGTVAGGLKYGYVSICIDYRHYPAHRLAWLYVHGRWPNGEVDHINRRRADNRIANLREATRKDNSRNGSLRQNSSGAIGVSWDAQTERWRAHITVDGKMLHLGRFDSIAEAVAARQSAAAEHFGAFAPGAAA